MESETMEIAFRLAEEQDIPAINRIYNQAIRARHQTADLQEQSLEQTLAWLKDHPEERNPVYVLEQKGAVIGWSALGAYRKGRIALEEVAEISYYLDQSVQGKGLGKALFSQTIERAKKLPIRILVAILLDSNLRSITLLQRNGFREWGRIPRAAKIEGAYVDHLYFGKELTRKTNQ